MYNLGIQIYEVLIKFFSRYNEKAKRWVLGRENIFERMEEKLTKDEKIVWFHASSLGEFEQGRPVIEGFKREQPAYKIFLTFFSPSGYEVRKNYEGADYIFYLPHDTRINARRFIELINPKFVVFIKYEFWKNYLDILKEKKIPVYLISAIFRKNQLFFKFYAGWYQKVLNNFEHIFVQDARSKFLLDSIGYTKNSIAGDTRFDRVYEISKTVKSFPLVKEFAKGNLVFIIGSSWSADEEILVDYLNSKAPEVKYIIAPHEVHKSNIKRIVKSIEAKVILYSQAKIETVNENQVLVIDNIGLLSSLFQYGDIAYIGGGFGTGIHNILEPATFGMPVLFGPKYHDFKEALDLVQLGAAFPIEDFLDFKEIFEKLLSEKAYLSKTSKIAEQFITNNKGATSKIIDFLLAG